MLHSTQSSRSRITPRLGFLLAALTVALLYGMQPSVSLAQEPAAPTADTPAADTPVADTPAADAPASDSPEGEAPSTEDNPPAEPEAATGNEEGDATPSDEPGTEATDEPSPEGTTSDDAEGDPAAAPEESEDTPSDDAGEGDAAEDEAAASSFDWYKAGLILAALVVPIVLGNWFAAQIKMPDHAWKISTVLMSIALGALFIGTGKFKGGIDLSGGVNLVYEIADKKIIADDDDDAPAQQESERANVTLSEVIAALKRRVDPAGTKEVSIRPYGDNIEVIIPQASNEDLAFIKQRLTDPGELEFRITASRNWKSDERTIAAALKLPPNQMDLIVNGRVTARWVKYNTDEFSENDSRIVTRKAGSRNEALVLIDTMNVEGKYLSSTRSDTDENGRPAVSFNFNAQGSARFGKLTGDNLPNASSGAERYLGILLNKELISAPSIQSKITSNGQISGGSMTEKEVKNTVAILQAGSLPAALNPEPISEYTVSPTLGEATIKKAMMSIVVSLSAVLVFILFYYRFAGIVACMALALNLLLVLGLMVLFDAAFTLPGMAGLVLTVGMSVDANVLIFERIREEMDRGASLRMAIRNGFDRATTTIVDANVTTLITGVVLYAIGTDQIKGFAVTLTLGILMSMYTAIFCSRLVFDIAERKRWIKSLHFSRLIGKTNWDFIGKRGVAAALSLLLITAGLVGVFSRGGGLLDIDFTGGTSVTQVFSEGNSATVTEVQKLLQQTALGENNLSVSKLEESASDQSKTGSRFTINTSIEDVQKVKNILVEKFGDKLMKFSVDTGEVKAAEGFDGSEVELTFNEGPAYGAKDGLGYDALLARISAIVESNGHQGLQPILNNPDYLEGSNQRFKTWKLRLGLPAEATSAVVTKLKSDLEAEPIFPMANKIGSRVAGDLQTKAIQAILVSLLGIVGYIWFRFQNVAFGLAAVVALVHDVLITLGAVAVSAYVVQMFPPLAAMLQIDSFQISLTLVAAFLTIIGYSLNDTIVIFDRVREVRGKSPNLTTDMVNTSINQTLSRTLLTSITTLIVVAILYAFGGPGIHSFAFALVIGVLAGTYSTIFVACPTLLAMVGKEPPGNKANDPKAKAA